MTETEAMRALERWPGYNEQSWQQRFAELDRRYEDLAAKVVAFATTNPLPLVGDREALIARLRAQAQRESEASRMMAEAKSRRQPDNAEQRTDLYSWSKPEQTDSWQAAEILATLRPTDLQAENERLREAATSRDALIAEMISKARLCAGGDHDTGGWWQRFVDEAEFGRLALNPESSHD